MIRNVPADAIPLRISELPRFTRIHGQLSPATLKKMGVREIVWPAIGMQPMECLAMTRRMRASYK